MFHCQHRPTLVLTGTSIPLHLVHYQLVVVSVKLLFIQDRVTEILVENGADLECKTYQGETPLGEFCTSIVFILIGCYNSHLHVVKII